MKEGIIAGLISGILSPIILSWLKYNIIWKSQRRHEVKYQAFENAVQAMSQYESDALDFKLQTNKSQYKNISKRIEIRPETKALIEKSRGMVFAFFSDLTSKKFESVFKEKISIENVPNIGFEEKKNLAIKALMHELGIRENKLIKTLTSIFKERAKTARP
jgi:hypothetical protein